MLRNNKAVLEEFNREITLLRSLHHPNILQFLGACSVPPNICLVTEYMPRGTSCFFPCACSLTNMFTGDLHQLIHNVALPLDKPLIKRIATDVARGMYALFLSLIFSLILYTRRLYLHSSVPVIIHRDLKSHNGST